MTTKRKSRYDYVATRPVSEEQPEKQEVLALTAKPEKTGEAAYMRAGVVTSGMGALQNPAAYALPPQRRGRRADEAIVKRTDYEREQLNVRIRPELKRAAAGLAGLRGMTLGDVVEAALIDYLTAARDQGE